MTEEIASRPLDAADLFEVPDLVEPVAAYRKWRVVDGHLRSLYMPVFWDERLQRAECHAEQEVPHMAPGSGCVCGIYASHRADVDFPTIDYRGVSGIVTVWGSLEVHADGFRAEYCQVEALSVYDRWTARQKDAVRSVAEALEVDVIDLDSLRDAAPRFGRLLDPAALGVAG